MLLAAGTGDRALEIFVAAPFLLSLVLMAFIVRWFWRSAKRDRAAEQAALEAAEPGRSSPPE